VPSDPLDAIAAGGAAYVDDRFDEARTHWEAAFRGLRDAGRPAGAARVATLLGELHWGGLGNASVGRGWLERARRLLEEAGDCVEIGYWELARLACDRPDTVEVEHSARRALDIAGRFGDVALQTRALADLGFALVCQGRMRVGFAHLEEALAALTAGEVVDPFAVSTSCCALLSACDRAGDAERAREWVRVVRELVLEPAGGRPRMLGAHCQIALGGVYCAAGDWTQAEAAVRAALADGAGATAAQRVQAMARLAELYGERGNLDEAAELLAPIEDDVAAAGPLARLCLARGETAAASAVLARAVDALGGDVLRRAELLLLAVEIGLESGQDGGAQAAAGLLRVLASDADADVVAGLADLADGLIAAAEARTAEATALLCSAQARFARTGRPVLDARAWLALASIADSNSEAVTAARAAHAIAVRLAATQLRDRSAAILRAHGAATPRSSKPGELPELTARESDILDGLRRGNTNAEIAARLFLSPKTVEHHVSRVLTKLGARTRAEAAAIAATHEVQRRP